MEEVVTSMGVEEPASFPISRSHIRSERLALALCSLFAVPAICAVLFLAAKGILGVEPSASIFLSLLAASVVLYAVAVVFRPNNFREVVLTDEDLILKKSRRATHVSYQDIFLIVMGGGRKLLPSVDT